ncbi:DUF2057 family protein [Psychrobacter sp. FDAARGOS_221]|uniref:DUF2057 family protein n=1 Tax=Psychrobacter sp. FDAARGOS_221 TaxID=1975705 RepID=UPI000BB53B5B|nr:DUF2057 family protein [Psychrobacter sp. FDAARGOS_221]PNK59755.1 DUF2057 domain-containing protein [Psychrobacter sp. FDAARGOS_221]
MQDNQYKTIINKLIAIGAVSACSLTLAHAEVTLQVDDNIKVTAINGKTVNSSPFMPIKKNFTLQPGQHVITAKYDRLYDLRRDEHDYLRSANITVTADMKDNQTYRLAMPGQPEKYEEAKKYVKAPTLAIMQGNTTIAQASGGSNDEGGLFSSISSIFTGSSDAQADNQRAIAAINANQPVNTSGSSQAIAPVAATPAAATRTVTVSQNADTLDQFMQIWLQASPDEREKIRQWIQK